MNKPVKNPCINRCKYDEQNVCSGCSRTKEEIVRWNEYTEEQKAQVIKNIIKRTVYFDNSMDHYI